MKILAIDDIKDNLTVLKAVIEDTFSGASIYTALSGKEGIELASAVDPDVILLDIVMPGMDGYEVCRWLKSHEQLQHIPVVFLTALKTSAENRIKALEAGGDGFLYKPIIREELIAQVKVMCKIKAAAEQKKVEKEQLEKMVTERTVELENEIKLRISTEQQLSQSEREYRSLIDDVLDTTVVGTFILDAQFRVVWINQAIEKYFGIKKEEALGTDNKKLIQEHIMSQLENPEEYARKVLATYSNNSYVKLFVCHILPGKGHKERWLEYWSKPIRSGLYKGGRIEHYTDITRQKSIELKLSASRERYKLVSDLTSDYIFEDEILKNGMTGHIWLARSFKAMTGYSPDEYGEIGGWQKIIHPEDIAVDDKAREKLFNNKKVKMDVRIRHKSGHFLWVRVHALPIWDKENNRLQKIIGSVKDITEEKNTEKHLKLSEERYHIVSNLTSDYVFQNKVNKEGENERIWVGGSFRKITGYTLEEFKKAGGWRSILHPDDWAKDEEAFNKIKKNQPVSIEVRIRHKSGRLVWVISSGHPIWNYEENRLVGIMGAVKDITKEKRNQLIQEIQYNIANRMVTATTMNDLFLSVKNELNKIICANNLFIAFVDPETGMLKPQFGEDEKEFVKEFPADRTLSGKVIKAGKPLIFKKEKIRKLAELGEIDLVGKRSEVWLGAPLLIKNKTLGIIVVQSYDDPAAYDEKAADILGIISNQLSLYIEEKRTEEFNQKLSKAMEQSPATVMITNTSGDIEYINPKFTAVTGYTLKEVLGKSPRIFKSDEYDNTFYKNLWSTVLSGKEWQGEFHNKKKNGELYWGSALISPIFNDTGEITHFLSIEEDITEKKKMLSELISAKEKAEESDRLKTAFLQNMSHEIRTPLNGILGFADLLTGDEVDPYNTKKYARYIKASGNRLLSLINNILDISRIESGSLSIQPQPFSINRLLKEAFQLFKIQAEKKNITFSHHLPLSDAKSVLLSDESKINQIITNLLGNAFKFTKSGSIDFGYKINGNKIIFWVSDTGRGVAPEHQAKIFERFYQADMSISRGFEGAGLGLPISKGLVELLGGMLWLESEVGKGTTFYFSLPYHPAVESTKQAADAIDVKRKKGETVVLIVEDDETSFLYLKTVLHLGKMTSLHAKDGLQAVRMCRENPQINLVLMDIKLPGMNGLEATRKIKAFRHGLPVIAQTAHAFPTDKKDAMKAGCDDFITKPIHKNELLKMITKYLDKGSRMT